MSLMISFSKRLRLIRMKIEVKCSKKLKRFYKIRLKMISWSSSFWRLSMIMSKCYLLSKLIKNGQKCKRLLILCVLNYSSMIKQLKTPLNSQLIKWKNNLHKWRKKSLPKHAKEDWWRYSSFMRDSIYLRTGSLMI